ncbi:MAG: T9SS type A sorting domain-containing protein [Dysgonamonadaceae bacterium]|jgi:hypothetical protein|nr:T9SS type A sorting domain-containing protein [Dysgonamonadaceae bacterium]
MRNLIALFVVCCTFGLVNAQNQSSFARRQSLFPQVVREDLPSKNRPESQQSGKLRLTAADPVLYGYKVSPSVSKGFIAFSPNSPGNITTLSTLSDGVNHIGAGDWVNGDYYVTTYSGGESGTATRPSNLVRIQADTWEAIATMPITEYLWDMAYDYSTKTMYGLLMTGEVSTLVRIGLTSGTLWWVADFDKRLVGIAVHTNGTMYGISVKGDLYKINKTTGALTLIGATGLSAETTPNNNRHYIQSINFDHMTGKLYWAYITNTTDGALYEVSTTNGAATNKGLIENSAEVVALCSPYFANANIPSVPTGFSITPNAGAVTATLHWTNPSLTRAGNPLTVISSLVVLRDGVEVHTIPNPTPGAAASWTDNLPGEGDYTYTIYGVTDDYEGARVTLSTFVGDDPCIVTAFPLKEGFEGPTKPDCWTNLFTEPNNEPMPSETVAHSGSQSWRFSSYFGADSYDQTLISPRLPITPQPKTLSFWYNTLTYDMERFYVGYSTIDNNPVNFQWVDNIEYVATNGWVQYKHTFPGDTKFIAIQYRTNYRWYVYIDDITIDLVADQDVAVTTLVSPQSGANLTAAETVSIKVKNTGTQAVSNIPVGYKLDGGVAVTGLISATLNPGAEVTYSFPTQIDLSQQKSYQLKVYTALPGDERRDNDTITQKITNFGNCVFTLPFSESFEDLSDLACWYIGYNNAAAKPGLAEFARTGKSSWAFSSKNADSDQMLITPEIYGTGKTISIQFYYNNPYFTSNTKEHFQIGYSTTDRQTFYWGQQYEVGFTNGWLEFFATVPADAKFISIHYFSDNQNHLYIDDLSVREIMDTDVAVTALVSPVSATDLSAAEQVKIKVKNTSGAPVSNIPVFFELDGVLTGSGNIDQTIQPRQEAIFVFDETIDMSQVKSYQIKVYTALPGDQALDNDTLVATVANLGVCKVTSLPMTQDFEQPLGMCWQNHNLDGDFIEWIRTKGNTHSGEYALTHLASPGNSNDWLISPKISIPDGRIIALYFWSDTEGDPRWDYRKYSVMVSTVSNDPTSGDFVEIWSPASVVNGWVEQDLSLAAYAGKDIYIAFCYQGGMGTSWTLDDILLKDITDIKDTGVTAILSPVISTGDMAYESVSVKVKNFGGQTLTSLPVKFEVDGELIGDEICIKNLKALQEVTYDFDMPADLSVAKTYTISAYTDLQGDMNHANDTISVKITNYGICDVTTFPYQDDFERDPDRFICWTAYDADGIADTSWQPASKLAGSTISAHSGNLVALHKDDSGDQDDWLISSPITIPSDGVYELSFWNFTAYPDYYYGDAKSSAWISTSSGDPASGDFQEVWTLSKAENSWSQAKVNLYAYAGETIYAAFRYQANYAHAWFLDDVRVARIEGADAGVITVLSPVPTDAGKSNVQVEVEIKNFGATELTSIPVAFKVNDGAPVEEILETNLLPGTKTTYTFTQTVDLSAYGKYVITAWTNVSDDQDESNNSAQSAKINHREDRVLYGYQIHNEIDPVGVVSFHSNEPDNLTFAYDYEDPSFEIVAAEFVNGEIYAYSEAAGIYHFIRLSQEWTELEKHTVNVATPSDMTYDHSTETMFAVVGAGKHSDLYRVDLSSGAMTLVGSTDRYIYTLAANLDGLLYGLDYNGILCEIDKNTGLTIEIGETGVLLTSAYQSMAFDHKTERLFWAGITYSYNNVLVEIDPETAEAEILGTLGIASEVVGLYTPEIINSIPKVNNDDAISMYPNPSKGMVYLKSVPANAQIKITDLSGRTMAVYHPAGGDVTLNLQLKAGVYFVVIEAGHGKTTRKLIIE